MIIGACCLTEAIPGALGEGRAFRRIDEVERAYETGQLDLHALIEYRSPELLDPNNRTDRDVYLKTTAGRILFNEALPEGARS
ncbi:MAG: hypothetical protein R2755_24935 [Acidimicrobiales bacterium]